MIKILFNEKRIFLTESYQTVQSQFNVNNAHILFDCNSEKLSDSLDLLMISEIENLLFVGNIAEILECIRGTFSSIIAGGGVVSNSRQEFLFIFRRGKWDLPKGKSEANEHIEDCALREVMEETGIRSVEIVKPLCITYHMYYDKEFIFKETYWYQMFSDDRMLRPQLEEGIKKVVWIRRSNIAKQLSNTYESIRDIFKIILPAE